MHEKQRKICLHSSMYVLWHRSRWKNASRRAENKLLRHPANYWRSSVLFLWRQEKILTPSFNAFLDVSEHPESGKAESNSRLTVVTRDSGVRDWIVSARQLSNGSFDRVPVFTSLYQSLLADNPIKVLPNRPGSSGTRQTNDPWIGFFATMQTSVRNKCFFLIIFFKPQVPEFW